MAAVSPTPPENARKIAATIFQALSRVGQNEVATTLGISDSSVSRLKEQVPQFAGMLARLGLKVVPQEMRCYDERTLASILELARQRMDQLKSPQQLAQDWDAE
jgi:hypothetical protein